MLKINRGRQLDAICQMKVKQKKMKSRDAMKSKSVACSVKSLTIQKIADLKLTSRFFNCKMLTLAKVPLISFIYELIGLFAFPNKIVKDIYSKNKILIIFATLKNLKSIIHLSLLLFKVCITISLL